MTTAVTWSDRKDIYEIQTVPGNDLRYPAGFSFVWAKWLAILVTLLRGYKISLTCLWQIWAHISLTIIPGGLRDITCALKHSHYTKPSRLSFLTFNIRTINTPNWPHLELFLTLPYYWIPNHIACVLPTNGYVGGWNRDRPFPMQELVTEGIAQRKFGHGVRLLIRVRHQLMGQRRCLVVAEWTKGGSSWDCIYNSTHFKLGSPLLFLSIRSNSPLSNFPNPSSVELSVESSATSGRVWDSVWLSPVGGSSVRGWQHMSIVYVSYYEHGCVCGPSTNHAGTAPHYAFQ